MRKILIKSCILKLAVLLLFPFLNASAQEKNAMAFVYKPTEGHALQVKRAGASKWEELRPPFHLYDGDSLRNGPRRQLVNMVDNSAPQIRFMLEPQEVRAFIRDARALRELQPPGRFNRLIQDFWDLIAGGSAPEMPGASRGRDGLDEAYLLYPYMTVLQTQPPFYWRRVKNSKRYTIELQEMQSGQTIFTATTPDTAIQIPNEKSALKWGEIYRVSLAAEGKSPRTFSFQVADDATIQAYRNRIKAIHAEIKGSPRAEQQRIESEIFYLIGNGFLSEAWLKAHQALPKFRDNEILRNAVTYYENALGIKQDVIE
jgi:hypothetical protein